MEKSIKATINSNKGFYIGDVCYVLNDNLYHRVWGDSGFPYGTVTDPETKLQFAVSGTAYGDGGYYDQQGREYGVDAGVIGIVPCELVSSKYDGRGGQIFEGAGQAIFESENGVFNITLPSGEEVHIDTSGDEDDEDDEY